ncbi:MAG: hypothetical protein OHK0044_25290 [Burkholderiaceae bacterium]
MQRLVAQTVALRERERGGSARRPEAMGAWQPNGLGFHARILWSLADRMTLANHPTGAADTARHSKPPPIVIVIPS